MAHKYGIPVIADGGVKYSGDLPKAVTAGADCIMIGSLFAGTEESPGDTVLYQGRTYKSFGDGRPGRHRGILAGHVEGDRPARTQLAAHRARRGADGPGRPHRALEVAEPRGQAAQPRGRSKDEQPDSVS